MTPFILSRIARQFCNFLRMSYLGDLPGLRWDEVKKRYFAPACASPDVVVSETPAGTSVASVPVDVRIQETLPHKRTSHARSCAICHDTLVVGVELPCGHGDFHAGCVSQWMNRRGTCPICRGVVDVALATAQRSAEAQSAASSS